MLRVTIKTFLAGPHLAFRRGQEVELPDAEALRLVAQGDAELIVPASSPDEIPGWPIKKIGPVEYLRKYPGGPNAELARKVLAAHAPAEVR